MASSENTFSACCLESFAWNGIPTGHESTLSGLPAYVTGTNSDAAVLYVHDALGWKFSNARLLADHFAREANVTVYIPDFFGGETLDKQALLEGRFQDLDMVGFRSRNAREIREPEVFACAKALREEKSYKKVGAVGYCYGGWAVCRLGSKIGTNPPLVDAIVAGHPSWLTKNDFNDLAVPVQILAPENDGLFTDELKLYAFQKLVLEKKQVPVEYVHFPGVAHGCLTKGDENVEGERAAMVKGKDAAVIWFRQWLSV